MHSQGVKKIIKLSGIVLLLGALYMLKQIYFPEFSLNDLIVWIQSQGVYGALVFALVYVVSSVLFLPGSVLTLAAGFMYGTVWGVILVSPVSVLAAAACFILGRYFMSDFINKKMRDYPKFDAYMQALEEEALKVVFLLRLSPLFPFNFLNYALGLSKISFRSYMLASWVGMLPGTILYVYIGSLASSLYHLNDQSSSVGWQKIALTVLGLGATFLVTYIVSKKAKLILQKEAQHV